MKTALVDENGELGALRGGDASVLLAAVGPRGSAKSSLLNRAFYTGFEEAESRFEQKTLGAPLERKFFASQDVAMVDVEGFDSSDERRYNIQRKSMVLAVALADVVLFNCYMHDMYRDLQTLMGPLEAAAMEVEKLEESKTIPSFDKIPLIVVVRDFEDEGEGQDEVLEAIKSEMPSSVTDKFAVDVIPVHNMHLQPNDFNSDVDAVREKAQELVAAAAENLRSKDVKKVWNKLEAGDKDVPKESDLEAAYLCNVAASRAWREMADNAEEWDKAIESRQIYENFKELCEQTSRNVLASFDEQTKSCKSSPAYKRKREELVVDMNRVFHDCYTRQIHTLKTLVFDNFRDELEGAEGGQDMKAAVDKIARDAKQTFVQKAEAMKPKGLKCKYDFIKKELFRNIQETSSAMMQVAQIRGIYVPPEREPVEISIHFLHPHPFGRDSKSEQLSMDDKVGFDVGRFQMRKPLGEPLRGPRVFRESRQFEKAMEKYVTGVKKTA
mmetsp:Transcript_12624/g.38642  ORF Transcript_12624/g.38642 Transcript_12624/m.38642 type:complete len:497 (+) Transcript_12624:41-1531(+)